MPKQDQQINAQPGSSLPGFCTGLGTAFPTSGTAMEFGRAFMSETNSSYREADLPVGFAAGWSVLRVCTEQGLVAHFAQPGVMDHVDHRDASSLAGTKRKIEEE